ncbi:MAG: hypothetical protein WCO33_02680 [bacterium]
MISIWTLLFIILIVINTIKGRPAAYIKSQDKDIYLITFISFITGVIIAQLSSFIENIFLFFILYSFIGFMCEFTADYLWYKIFGSRIYRYFDGNLLGFTSWYIIPIWGAAGLFFLGLAEITKVNLHLSGIDLLKIYLSLGFVGLLFSGFISGIMDYFKKKTSLKTNYFHKYLFIVFSFFSLQLAC